MQILESQHIQINENAYQVKPRLNSKIQTQKNCQENSIKATNVSTQYQLPFFNIKQDSLEEYKHDRIKNVKIQDKSYSTNMDEQILYNLDEDSVRRLRSNYQKDSQSNSSTLKNSQSFVNFRSQRKYCQRCQDKQKQSMLYKYINQSQKEFQKKAIYESGIGNKNQCQGCIKKMHQLSSMQLLKNQYYKSFLQLKHEVEKLKKSQYIDKANQNQNISLHFNQIIDHHNQQAQQKSESSFQNQQTTLLAERITIQIHQFQKLIDTALLFDISLIDPSLWDSIQFEHFQQKINQLKSHLHISPAQLIQNNNDYNQIQIKTEKQIKTIHQRYKKLIEKMVRNYKQRQERTNLQVLKINSKFVQVLIEKNKIVLQMNKSTQIEHTIVQALPISRKFSIQNKISSSIQNMATIFQQKNIELEKKIQKYNSKIKDLENTNKKKQNKIQQLFLQIAHNQKKSASDLCCFMSRIAKIPTRYKMIQKQNKANATIYNQTKQQGSQTLGNKIIRRKTFSDIYSFQISDISQMVYEIFSYTSDDLDTQQNIFCPQTKQELLKMLCHIKQFNKNFDTWQKDKEKQMIAFQKNFLKLIKFFIDSYQITQEKLLQQIDKIDNMEPLKDYIRKYYIIIMQEKSRRLSQSSQFTFGKTSAKDMSQIQLT